jgi:hypothetical protein
VPIELVRPDLPREVVAIVERMMAKCPDDRFATALEVAAALEPYAHGREEPALPAARGATPPALPPALTATESPRAISISVRGKLPWQDTHVDIAAGQSIRTWTKGEWRDGPVACSGEGLPGKSSDGVRRDAPSLCLLGRIGEEEATIVLGQGDAITVDHQGRLFVQANDLDLEDNSGTVVLMVQGGTYNAADASAPSPVPVEEVTAQLRALHARVEAAPVAALHDDALGLWRRSRGTPEGVKAAALLREVPSPLDALERSAFPAALLENEPSDVVAVGGDPHPHVSAGGEVVYAPDGRLVAWAVDGRIVVWDLAPVRRCVSFDAHVGPVHGLAFALDGKTLASCGDDGTIRLWDAGTGDAVGRLGNKTHRLWKVAWSTDGRHVAAATSEGEVCLWNVQTRDEDARLLGHAGDVRSVAFSADGRHLLSAGADQSVRLWDVEAIAEMRQLAGCQDGISRVSFAPDGRRVMAVGWDRVVHFWDLASGGDRDVMRICGPALTWADWSPDGKIVAGTTDDGRVVAWDIASRNVLREWHLSGPVWSLAFAPDSRHLAVARADGTLSLFRLALPACGTAAKT